jgi:hypothetical protein
MSWVRLDDNFPEHPKIARAGGDAAWLHVCALAYCSRNLTDGLVPNAVLKKLSDRRNPIRLAAQLVDAGLWEREEAGWRVHDYLKFQPSRADVETERAQRSLTKAEAGRRGGIASGVSRRRANEAATKHEAERQADTKQNDDRSNSEARSKHEAPTRPVRKPRSAVAVASSLSRRTTAEQQHQQEPAPLDVLQALPSGGAP